MNYINLPSNKLLSAEDNAEVELISEPKLLWKGDFLDGNLEIIGIPMPNAQYRIEFNLLHDVGNGTFTGVTTLNLTSFKNLHHLLSELLTMIEHSYTSAMLDHVKGLVSNGTLLH